MTILDQLLIGIDDLQPVKRQTIYSTFHFVPKAVLASALARMIKFNEIDLDNQNDSYHCTQLGTNKILENLEELDQIRSERSLNWYLCIFAIPEKNKVDREKLRSVLRNFGFGKLRGGLFIAHRASVHKIEAIIQKNHLEQFVHLIKLDHLPATYLEQHASSAWYWQELEAEYFALIADIEEFLKQSPTDQTVKRITAKILVYRLALLSKKDPYLDEVIRLKVSLPRQRLRKLYYNLKPFCY